jgi:hypothetical protein
MEENVKMKSCSKCKNMKPINEFFRNRCFADGYANQCKVCKNSNPKISHPKIKCVWQNSFKVLFVISFAKKCAFKIY